MRKSKLRVMMLGVVLGSVLSGTTLNMPVLQSVPELIDGDLSEDCWQQALKTGPFRKLDGGQVKDRTLGFLFMHDQDLYVGMECFFSNRAKALKDISDDKGVFAMDVAEIFIDPGATGNYQHIAINAAGKLFFPGKLGDMRYAVQLHDDHWTLEAKIPSPSIRITGSRFASDWRINLARGNRTAQEDVTWVPLMNGTFHEPSSFYRLSGIKVDLTQLKKRQQLEHASDFTISLDRMLYDKQDYIKGNLDINYRKSMKGFQLVASVSTKRGEKVYEQTFKPVFFKTHFNLPLKDIPNGTYSLTLHVRNAAGKDIMSGRKTFWKIPPQTREPKNRLVIKHHNFYLNGKFFFPMFSLAETPDPKANALPKHRFLPFFTEYLKGDYREAHYNCVTGVATEITTEKNFECIKRFSGLPVWCWKEWQSRVARNITLNDMIDARLKAGVYTIVNPLFLKCHGDISEEMIDYWVKMMLEIRDYDTILMWDMADETDGQLASNKLRYQLYKEMDPKRLAWFNVINAVSQNQDFADVLSTDPYPIPLRRVSMVGAHVDRLVDTFKDKPDKSYMVWLQLFGGEGKLYSRPPTPEEMEVMAYIAMNHGTKGIGWWIFQPPSKRYMPRQNPATFERQKVVNKRILELAPAYCLGKKLLLTVQQGIDVAVLQYQGKLYVSCANTLNQNQKVLLRIPVTSTRNGKVRYENRPVMMREGIIEDSFDPYQVHIYEF